MVFFLSYNNTQDFTYYELVDARRRGMRGVKKGKWPRVLYLWKKGKRREEEGEREEDKKKREREKWKGLVTKERAKLVVGPIQTFLSKFEGPRGSTSRNLFSRIPPFKWPGVCSPGLVSFHCSRLIFEARPECPLQPCLTPAKGKIVLGNVAPDFLYNLQISSLISILH